MALSWLNLFLILLAAWLAGAAISRLGYSAVLGELVAGIILGPSLLGLLRSDAGIAILGYLGILMMSFFVGTRIQSSDLVHSRSAALPLIGSFLVPLLAGLLVMTTLFGADALVGLLVGTVIGTTSLLAMVRFVSDLSLLSTRVGQTLMTVALFSTILVMATFAAVQGIARASATGPQGVALVLGTLLLFLVAFTLVGLYLFRLLGTLQERLVSTRTDASALAFAILLALIAAWAAEQAGLTFILGSFLAGLFLRPSMFEHDTFRRIFDVVRDVARGFLSPIFYVTAGFSFSFAAFTTDLGVIVALVLLAILAKVLGGFLFHLVGGHGWREAVVLGLGLNARGSLDVVIALLALQAGLISPAIYTGLLCAIIVSTLIVPLFLKWGAAWLAQHGELRDIQGTPVPLPAPIGPGVASKVTL